MLDRLKKAAKKLKDDLLGLNKRLLLVLVVLVVLLALALL